MGDKIYAVISLGSSYITAMLATKLPNGRINPISYAQRRSAGSVVHGCIHNIIELSQIIDNLLETLAKELPEEGATIRRIYVGIDCQSMRSHTFKSQAQFEGEGVILEAEHLKKLTQQAEAMGYAGRSVLHITEPRYYVDGRRVTRPIGVRCKHIEANYQLISVRREIETNIYEVFEKRLGLVVEHILLNPLAEAMLSLSREELTLGCAYINIGGGTTSISIYQDRLLTALYVLPLGGINVTKDLMKLKLLEADAEHIKLQYGSMDLEVDKKETLQANSINGLEKSLLRYDVNSYIHARMKELTNNILQLIKEIDPELRINALLFSGGAVRLKDYIPKYFDELGLSDGVRYATVRPDLLHESAPALLLSDYQTALGLVALAKVNCIEIPVAPIESLFTEDGEARVAPSPREPEVHDDEDHRPDYGWGIENTDQAYGQDDKDASSSDEDGLKPSGLLSHIASWGQKLAGVLENALGSSTED